MVAPREVTPLEVVLKVATGIFKFALDCHSAYPPRVLAKQLCEMTFLRGKVSVFQRLLVVSYDDNGGNFLLVLSV